MFFFSFFVCTAQSKTRAMLRTMVVIQNAQQQHQQQQQQQQQQEPEKQLNVQQEEKKNENEVGTPKADETEAVQSEPTKAKPDGISTQGKRYKKNQQPLNITLMNQNCEPVFTEFL